MLQPPIDLTDEVAVRKYFLAISTKLAKLEAKKPPLVVNISSDVTKENIDLIIDYINNNLR